MAFTLKFIPHQLKFKFQVGTSRGVLTQRNIYYLLLFDEQHPKNRIGLGEVSPLEGLSIDFDTDWEAFLKENENTITIDAIENQHFINTPAFQFGIETAFLDWKNRGNQIIFDNNFSRGKKDILINGLIWMGTPDFMEKQIEEKLKLGFQCLKLKIGALDFETELSILKNIRKKYKASEITLRVDANGAFKYEEALIKLNKLAELDLHSIEQPIKSGQVEKMAELCEKTPLPIALDEELIGIINSDTKKQLLNTIKPQYIVLKPTLLGGFKATQDWIALANESKIGWWITSALESNVGLNAIAQFTAEFDNHLPQGLGTGQLYTNNTPTLLKLERQFLSYAVYK
jgi:o-succinylbenzoate synthase